MPSSSIERRVDLALRRRVEPFERRTEHLVDRAHGLEHAFAAVALRVAVAQLDGFVRAGRRARRNHRFFDRAEAGRDRSPRRRISARIEDFARVHAFDQRPAAAAQRFERHRSLADPALEIVSARNELVGVEEDRSSRSALLGCCRCRARDCARSSARKSARIVPGAALSGLVAPIIWRQPSIAPSPSTAIATSGPLVMKSHEAVEERLALVFGVMLARTVAVELHQFHRRNHVAAALEAGR